MLSHDPIDELELRQYSPIVLAYIGDAAFELMVRTHMVASGKKKVKDLHHDTVQIVKAESQARLVRQMFDELTEDEQDIVRRGRNAKSSPSKNAHVQDYRMSTGFEALLGYLYLKGDYQRLASIFDWVFDIEDAKEIDDHGKDQQ